jgi:hypothetical protein
MSVEKEAYEQVMLDPFAGKAVLMGVVRGVAKLYDMKGTTLLERCEGRSITGFQFVLDRIELGQGQAVNDEDVGPKPEKRGRGHCREHPRGKASAIDPVRKFLCTSSIHDSKEPTLGARRQGGTELG